MIFKKHIKQSLLAVLLAALCTVAHAVPGMIQYIPDSSGEYVYYSDKSFSRTSILGFLYYNDSTYALRYYAPADVKNKLKEKDITLYFSVDPDSNYLNLTGENIIGATSEEDTDIVNYMHDLFYEFTARAQKAFLDGNQIIESRQDFDQFGGKVTIVFNTQVPLFNIEAIKAADGTKIMSVLTTGALTSSADKSFTDYKGGEVVPKDKNRGFKKTSSKKMAATFGNQTINLTQQWKQKMENLWFMDDYAVLTMNKIEVPAEYKSNLQLFQDVLVRHMSESTTGSYVSWMQKKIVRGKNSVSLTNVYYQPENGDVTRDFNILTKCSDGSYGYVNLTVFDGIYQKNKSYFDGILKSYSAK